jgi:hypothetical protein
MARFDLQLDPDSGLASSRCCLICSSPTDSQSLKTALSISGPTLDSGSDGGLDGQGRAVGDVSAKTANWLKTFGAAAPECSFTRRTSRAWIVTTLVGGQRTLWYHSIARLDPWEVLRPTTDGVFSHVLRGSKRRKTFYNILAARMPLFLTDHRSRLRCRQ